MKKMLDIWFPNYKNNPGIVSKELISTVEELTKNFDVQSVKGKFLNNEHFELELDINDSRYENYITELLYSKLGRFPKVSELETGEEVLGRVYSPGKVGFGIFIDIGIRDENKQTDALLPLYQLREDLEIEDISTREIVKLLGLIDGYPIPVEINEIDKDDDTKIGVSLADEFLELIQTWAEDRKERMIFTKSLRSKIRTEIKNSNLKKYVDSIQSIDPLTTVVVCSSNTNASGLVPRLGAKLPRVPIGIFHP